MRLLSWNIRQGGGERARQIAAAIDDHAPDVVALSEYRAGRGEALCSRLGNDGLTHVESTTPANRGNGLCVLSRKPLRRRPDPPVAPENADRWLNIDIPDLGVGIGVLHIPDVRGGKTDPSRAAKTRFWEAVLASAENLRDMPFLFVGDLNTGSHRIDEAGRTFFCDHHFERMTELGWTDLWRAFNSNGTEYTWYSKLKGGARGNGFRLDHAFASPALVSRVRACRYSHGEREQGASDHSILLVDIGPPASSISRADG